MTLGSVWTRGCVGGWPDSRHVNPQTGHLSSWHRQTSGRPAPDLRTNERPSVWLARKVYQLEGVYPLCDQSFQWDVFWSIKDIKNYHFGMNIWVVHLCNLILIMDIFYSIQFTFIRPRKPSKAVASHSGFPPLVAVLSPVAYRDCHWKAMLDGNSHPHPSIHYFACFWQDVLKVNQIVPDKEKGFLC